jgi:hypothetical protein
VVEDAPVSTLPNVSTDHVVAEPAEDASSCTSREVALSELPDAEPVP